MDTNTLIAISTLATIIVGIILSRQIKSQKEIIDDYKKYIESIDVSKLKELNSSEKEKIIEINKIESNLLHNQFQELFIYCDRIWTVGDDRNSLFKSKEEFDTFLSIGFPHCKHLFSPSENQTPQ